MGRNGHAPEPEWEINFRDHFFFFPEKSKADMAAERLLKKGWRVQVSRTAGRDDWSVTATDPMPNEEEFEAQYQELKSLAEELGGEYDGYGGPG
ncbi:MAG TPA: ribonuclease E inhibitor RraB [Candidatus Angelobacter sp.]